MKNEGASSPVERALWYLTSPLCPMDLRPFVSGASDTLFFNMANTYRCSAAPTTRFGTSGCWIQGKLVADAPNFERYGKQFDRVTGIGPIELWLPVEN
jgi:hypothetical protein